MEPTEYQVSEPLLRLSKQALKSEKHKVWSKLWKRQDSLTFRPCIFSFRPWELPRARYSISLIHTRGARPVIFKLGLKYLPLNHPKNPPCKNLRLGKEKYITMTEFTIKTFPAEARRTWRVTTVAGKVSCTPGGTSF